jgi:hypothetical protein
MRRNERSRMIVFEVGDLDVDRAGPASMCLVTVAS